MSQAKLKTTHGRTVKRWAVSLPLGVASRPPSFVMWAESRAGIVARCLDRYGVRPEHITPMPPSVNMQVQDALAELVREH